MLKKVTFLLFLFTSVASTAAVADEWPAIDDFTSSMQVQPGFYAHYYDADSGKLYLRIETLQQPFIFQSSLPRGVGSNDIGLDRGQLGDTRLAQFERFGKNVLLKQLNTTYRAMSDNLAEQASIDEAFADSVIAGLPIVAVDDDAILVDYTDFLLSDIHGISLRLARTEQGAFKADKNRSGVYMPRTKAFADNTEMEALVTFVGSKPGQYVRQVSPEPTSISVHLHHSLIRLPDDEYQTRQFHPYSGFWKVGYKDYATQIDESMDVEVIPRHRLRKKDPTAEVSEAVEPIVYYLDPGIPEPVMSALREGAQWWDQAFAAIGYKDAFQVKVLPEGADPMDVRYNVIQWVHRATRGWSYGSSVIDPRTGEIVKGHVTLGSLRVRQDYLIALGLTSPFDSLNASTDEQKEMALARIRQLSAHEVGHTLGIAHNFAASEDGRASVMDYPHPKITIKEGKISLDDAYATGIAEWDKHVVAYGYQDFSDPQQEQQALMAQLQETRQRGLKYKSDPDARVPQRASADGHLWDNGAEPIAAFEQISAVRKLALSNFGLNSLPTGANLSSLAERLVPIYLLHRYQLDALVKLIGGVNYMYEQKDDFDSPQGVTAVDADTQERALLTLLSSIRPSYLQLPESLLRLIPPKAYGERRDRESFSGRTGITFDPVSAAESAAAYSLDILLHPSRLNRLSVQHALNDDLPGVAYTVAKVIDAGIKEPEEDESAMLAGRLKHITLDRLMAAQQHSDLAPEVRAEVLSALVDLEKWLSRRDDEANHQIMLRWLRHYWQTGEWMGKVDIRPMPPGSPI